MPEPPRAWTFGSFHLDADERTLVRGEESIPLREKVFETLVVLVDHAGRLVEKDDLMEAVWPDAIVEEGNLAHNVSVLRKALGDTPGEASFIETVPKRGYRFVAPVEPAAPSAPVAVETAATPVPERSIAVLPFDSLSDDPSNEWFSEGMTDSILTALARVEDLKVISRTSAARLKEAGRTVRQIGIELGVAHVMEGSVQRAGDRLRIGAQLVDARTEDHLWAERYDRDVDDLFAIQSDVAERIVAALDATLSPAERTRLESRPTESLDAWITYQKGVRLLAGRTGDCTKRAIGRFRIAIAEDPGFALAHAGLAEALALLPYFRARPTDEALGEAREAAARAMELDDRSAEAHVAAGLIAVTGWEWDRAEEEYRRAIGLAPGFALAWHWYGNLATYRGEHEAALARFRRAMELDPLSLPVHTGLGFALLRAGRPEEALEVYREAAALDPAYPNARMGAAWVYETTGRFEKALDELAVASRLDPAWFPGDVVGEMRAALGASGESGYWKAKCVGLESSEGPYGRDLDRAAACVALGEADEALAVLEGIVERREAHALMFPHAPAYAPIRDEERFRALLERMGL